MPQSRNRHKHHQQQPHHHSPVKPKRSAAMVLAIFVAFLGVAIALFTVGTDILWMIVGAATGGVTGYLIGKNMDNAVAKNK